MRISRETPSRTGRTNNLREDHFIVAGGLSSPKNNFCATLYIFISLTVTGSSTERTVPFLQQHPLGERAIILRYTYIAYLV
jgi:hypothetical protein